MDAEGWLTSELASFTCGACGQAYGESHVRLIAQREELFFVDLSCRHCGSQAVAIVTIQIEETPSQEEAGWEGAAVDDGPTPAPRVSVDDVIDMHRLLDGFRGDARELIRRLDGKMP